MARKGVGNLCISLTFLLVFMKTEFYDTRGFVYCADIRREPKLLRLFTISFRIGCEALHWRMFLNRLCCVLRNNDDVVLGREGERKRERERDFDFYSAEHCCICVEFPYVSSVSIPGHPTILTCVKLWITGLGTMEAFVWNY